MPTLNSIFARPLALALCAAGAMTAPALTVPALAGESAVAITQEESINAPYNAFLAKYVTQKDGINLVAYGDVTDADHQALKGYIKTLEGLKPSTMSRDEQLAYWANLYNAVTVDIVVDAYPVPSIKNVMGGVFNTGPWKQKLVTVEGEEMSLDNIEHDTVRASFDEPRVHYAFNCASIGCPNLRTSAWEAATLDADLDAAAAEYLSHPRGVRVENGRVIASSIFKWFREDFGGNDQGVLDHIREHAPAATVRDLEGKTRVNRHEYDWDLNEG